MRFDMFVVLPGLDETAILSAFLANSMKSYFTFCERYRRGLHENHPGWRSMNEGCGNETNYFSQKERCPEIFRTTPIGANQSHFLGMVKVECLTQLAGNFQRFPAIKPHPHSILYH